MKRVFQIKYICLYVKTFWGQTSFIISQLIKSDTRLGWTNVLVEMIKSPLFKTVAGKASQGKATSLNETILPPVPPLFVTFCFLITQGQCGSECATWPESNISLFIASVFAENMGFIAEDLTTNKSMNIFSQWLKGNCQPNYRKVCVCVLECGFLTCVGYIRAASKRLILSSLQKLILWERWCPTVLVCCYSLKLTRPLRQ